jgi:hypothetical protein
VAVTGSGCNLYGHRIPALAFSVKYHILNIASMKSILAMNISPLLKADAA